MLLLPPDPFNCKPVVKIYDTDDVLNPCFSYEMNKDKEAVIDLKNLKDANGKAIDLTHIYMVAFQTDASQTLYITNVYLSQDGTTPTTAIDEVQAPGTIEDGFYYDLLGRRVLQPAAGIYIKNGKKVLVH